MTDTPHDPPTDPDASIAAKTDRLETIVERLEDGEVPLERANELHSEGRELLEALRDDLDFDDGSVTLRE